MVVFINLPQINYDYFLGVNDEKPKIIIVGSSNIRHNFDFELLNKTIENYSVLGISINASSGLYPLLYKLNQLEPHDEDIIVMALPYSLYNESRFLPLYRSNKFISLDVVENALYDFPEQTVKSLCRMNFMNLLSSLKTINLSVLDSRLDKNETSINIKNVPLYKDSLYYACFTDQNFDFSINDSVGKFSEKELEQIAKFLSKEYGNIYFRHPVTTKGHTTLNIKKIERIEDYFTFINNVSEAEFGKSNFYDKWYHLNYCGAQENTRNFIDDLELFIEGIVTRAN